MECLQLMVCLEGCLKKKRIGVCLGHHGMRAACWDSEFRHIWTPIFTVVSNLDWEPDPITIKMQRRELRSGRKKLLTAVWMLHHGSFVYILNLNNEQSVIKTFTECFCTFGSVSCSALMSKGSIGAGGRAPSFPSQMEHPRLIFECGGKLL